MTEPVSTTRTQPLLHPHTASKLAMIADVAAKTTAALAALVFIGAVFKIPGLEALSRFKWYIFGTTLLLSVAKRGLDQSARIPDPTTIGTEMRVFPPAGQT